MLEENRLYNMDCLDGIRQVKTASVKAIITDPPYFQGLTQNGQRGDFSDLEITRPFWQQLAKQMGRVLTPDGEFYICMDWRGEHMLAQSRVVQRKAERWLKRLEAAHGR